MDDATARADGDTLHGIDLPKVKVIPVTESADIEVGYEGEVLTCKVGPFFFRWVPNGEVHLWQVIGDGDEEKVGVCHVGDLEKEEGAFKEWCVNFVGEVATAQLVDAEEDGRADTGVEETHYGPKAQAAAGALGENEGRRFVVRTLAGELVLETEDLSRAVSAADENAPAIVETLQTQGQIEDLLHRALVFSGAEDHGGDFLWANELGAAIGGVTLAAYAQKTETDIPGTELVKDPDAARDETLRLLGAILGAGPDSRMTVEQLAEHLVARSTGTVAAARLDGSLSQAQIVEKLRSPEFMETVFDGEPEDGQRHALTEAIERAFGWEAI